MPVHYVGDSVVRAGVRTRWLGRRGWPLPDQPGHYFPVYGLAVWGPTGLLHVACAGDLVVPGLAWMVGLLSTSMQRTQGCVGLLTQPAGLSRVVGPHIGGGFLVSFGALGWRDL